MSRALEWRGPGPQALARVLNADVIGRRRCEVGCVPGIHTGCVAPAACPAKLYTFQ